MTSNFTTGATILPDVGTLNYNGCTFSPLFESSVSGAVVKDEAQRTVKYTEVSLTADGYVTMGANASLAGIAPTMATMHQLLTAQSGALTYKGRGWDIVVNVAGKGGGLKGPGLAAAVPSDVAWGPVPELLDFQPLGGGLSAKVKWKVTIRVPAMTAGTGFSGSTAKSPLLQFNFETSVAYGEDGFTSLSMRGTLELPMTRPTQAARSVPTTADDFRIVIEKQLLGGIDLTLFRITHREFNTSRDKRTLTWDISAEEKPYMDLPPYCTVARGSFQVRPARAGAGLVLWLCTLSATYTLEMDVARRRAYLMFLSLLRLRMSESVNGHVPRFREVRGDDPFDLIRRAIDGGGVGQAVVGGTTGPIVGGIGGGAGTVNKDRNAILLDFNINEGLYLDSKSVTFSATWRITTNFSHILMACGLWAKVNENKVVGSKDHALWATGIKDIMGSRSWLANQLDPNLDVIVDFGASE